MWGARKEKEKSGAADRGFAGKTTLLRALLGLGKRTGEVVWDRSAAVGYLPQRWDDACDAHAVETRFAQASRPHARTLLGALGVSGAAFTKPLGALSGGQKRKVRLAELIVAEPNVLVLDEPTTHLDYVSVELLEAALLAFSGTLVLVSHDRYLTIRTTERRLEL